MEYKTTLLMLIALAPLAKSEFHTPVKLSNENGPIGVEKPGHASPCLADIDQDGKDELLVGQFRGGNISIYEISDLSAKTKQLGEKRWMMDGEKRAEVPGVW